MRDVMGIIYTSKNDLALRELTMSRAVGALPVAGRYRIIDFILSNMVNTGIRNVGVIMQRNYHSLMDHIGSGREWDLHTRNDGLFILPPFLTRDNVGTYEGSLDALHSNMGYLRRSKQEYVILTNSHTVLNTTFHDMIESHEDSGAEVTLMYACPKPGEISTALQQTRQHAYLKIDELSRQVVDLEIGPVVPSCNNFSMDIMLIKRKLLVELVNQAYADSLHDLNRDLLQRYIRSEALRVNGYQYKGYSRRIESVDTYYRFNLDMIHREVRDALFRPFSIFTKIRDEVPSYYAPTARVRNTLMADGCIIEGKVENCVLFRGVHIAKGVSVKNSILMQDDFIEENVELENVILDKNVRVSRGQRLIGAEKYPIVIGKNTAL